MATKNNATARAVAKEQATTRLSMYSLRYCNKKQFAELVATERAKLPSRGKPGRCPYCNSRNVSSHLGRWECGDCGREGSY